MMQVISLILLSYGLLVIVLIIGWHKSMTKIISHTSTEKFISVIVPFRNEEQHIENLLSALAAQTHAHFEILAVDDHSTDESFKKFSKAGSAFRNLQVLTNPGKGKKSAITYGMYQAKGELIVTTDADCLMAADWLKTMSIFFDNDQVKMVFGAVRVKHDETLFSNMQAIEFASLIGSSAATAAFGVPVMCNGANLAYTKEVFLEVNGYAGNEQIASGDDEFLMRKIVKLYPAGIRFAGVHAATVDTYALPDIASFLRQRIRWAAKWRWNTSIYAVALALFIAACQIASIWCIVALFKGGSLVPLYLLLSKALVECIFLRQVCHFLSVRWNLTAFIFLQIFYPFYVIGVGIASNFIPYSWKDRKIR